MRRLSPSRVFRGVLWRCARRTQLNILSARPSLSESGQRSNYLLTRVRPDAPAADRHLAEDAMRRAGEPAGLVNPRLARGDELFGLQLEGRIVCFNWITYHDRRVGPIRLPDVPGRVFFYNAFTLQEHRGRGLFTSLLRAMRSALSHEGATEFVADVDVRNGASARALEKAGFIAVTRLSFLTILNRWRWPLTRPLLPDSVGRIR
jgi:GNAT superfamily N-acetyltransferase